MRGLRLGGHPLHPALVHFPVVCWTVAPVLDLVYLLTQAPVFWQAEYICLAIGVIMGLVAMCAGLMDLVAIPAESPPSTRAPNSTVSLGAKAASRHAGTESSSPSSSISLRP